MNRFLYVTEGNKLVGMQDVSSWPVRSIYKAARALETIGREGFVSEKGVSICCICRGVLREVELPAGQVSHGLCHACRDAESEKIQYIESPDEFDRA